MGCYSPSKKKLKSVHFFSHNILITSDIPKIMIFVRSQTTAKCFICNILGIFFVFAVVAENKINEILKLFINNFPFITMFCSIIHKNYSKSVLETSLIPS